MLVGEERFRVQTFLALLVLFAAATATVMGMAELGGLVHPRVPLVGHGLALIGCLYIIVTYITASDRKIVRFIATGGSEIILAMLLVSMLAATVLFGLVCREIYRATGEGFAGTPPLAAAVWIGFGFDNLFEALFLDAPNIYQVQLVSITADHFWTQTLVLVFRTVANLLILRAALRYLDFLRRFLFSERLSRGR